jgi:hypothetical protein
VSYELKARSSKAHSFLWISFCSASHFERIAMTNNEILQADLLDILFEHRNKAYGAYALRRNYNDRLQWALGIHSV